MSDLPEFLFVYGTLRSDIPSSMSKFLRRRGELVGRGTTPGRLIDLGGYPGFVATEGEETVRGEVHRIHADRAEETWHLLDAYEGVSGLDSEDYRRNEVEVALDNGDAQTAVTYEFQQAETGRAVIADGDYPPFYATNPTHQKFTGND